MRSLALGLLWPLLALAPSAFAADDASAAPAPSPTPAAAPDARSAAGAVDASAEAPGGAAQPLLPLDDLRTFVEVIERIRSAYVEDIDDATLFEHAIRGMLDALDPHSAYLIEQDYENLQEATTGTFGGVGLEVGFDEGVIRVITPLDDTPAERAGLLAGDVLVAIDDTPVDRGSLDATVDAMRGKPGTPVRLTVRRTGETENLKFDLERAVIEITSVSSRLLEPGFGYLRISQFQDRTGADLERALRGLGDEPLDGLVLDLRNNPGGVLQASVRVADAFLEDGPIVSTRGRLAGAETTYNATAADLASGAPIVVLVNEGSASAAEIVAGALQDRRRAVVLGTPTFGKGSVQTVLPLSADRAIKLTTALYYTPNGRSIQAQGILPDITVERGSVQADTRRTRYREADLPGHLGAPTDAEGGPGDDAPRSALQSEDYQLAEALNLLKGLHLLSLRAEN